MIVIGKHFSKFKENAREVWDDIKYTAPSNDLAITSGAGAGVCYGIGGTIGGTVGIIAGIIWTIVSAAHHIDSYYSLKTRNERQLNNNYDYITALK